MPTERPLLRLASAFAPFVLLGTLYGGLILALTRRGLLWECGVIGLVLVLLSVTGASLVVSWSLAVAVRRAITSSIALTLVVWAWQRAAYLLLIPGHFLTYGYFQQPEGAQARLLLLEGPLWAVSLFLGIAAITSITVAWRSGKRTVVVPLAGWWLTTFVNAAMPSLYLWAQGDAGIFI